MSVAENDVAEAVNRRFAKFCCTSQCYVVFLRFVIWELISDNEGRVSVVMGGLLAAGGIEEGTSSLMCNEKSSSQLERHSYHTSLSPMFTSISSTSISKVI
jgi:hypothetical protein